MTEALSEALKNCPFCGFAPSDDLIDTLYPTGRWREDDGIRHYLLPDDDREAHGRVWKMRCQPDYGGCGAVITGDSEAETRAAWNRRPPSAVQGWQELAKAAREAADALQRSYDAVEWPADGTSRQELAAAALRAALAAVGEKG